MREVILALGILAAASAGASQASAAPANFANFNAVDASGNLRVEITQGDHFAVDISGPHADRVEAHVRGDTLVLGTRHSWIQFDMGTAATVRIVMPALRAIDSSAGVDVRVSGIRADALALDVSSGSDLRIAGVCNALNVSASSGAEIDAHDLHCATLSADASSGGSASVYASEHANIDASSGGDIRLAGEGRIGNVSLSSGGELHHAS